jgi:hypothetical protein
MQLMMTRRRRRWKRMNSNLVAIVGC